MLEFSFGQCLGRAFARLPLLSISLSLVNKGVVFSVDEREYAGRPLLETLKGHGTVVIGLSRRGRNAAVDRQTGLECRCFAFPCGGRV